jgi:hypothetical protein
VCVSCECLPRLCQHYPLPGLSHVYLVGLHCLVLQHLSVCSPTQRNVYISKSVLNVEAMQKLHSGVYLGTSAGVLHSRA